MEAQRHLFRVLAGLFEDHIEEAVGLSDPLSNISDAGCVLGADRSYGTKTRGDKALDCHRRYLRDSEAHHIYDSKGLVVLHSHRATGRPLDAQNTHTWRWVGGGSKFPMMGSSSTEGPRTSSKFNQGRLLD